MNIIDFLAAIDGVAQLYAGDNQFLGVLSSNQYDVNSISNACGLYGSTCGVYSIRNSVGIYGSSCGIYSPYNTYCQNPPIVIYQGQVVFIVTNNSYAQTYGLPVVDPDLLLGVYAQLRNSIPVYNPVLDYQQQQASIAQTLMNNTSFAFGQTLEINNQGMNSVVQSFY